MFGISNKASTDKDTKPISTKQVSVIPARDRNIFVDNLKTISILQELLNTQNNMDAIDIIVNKTPDGKHALNTYLRLANQGVEVTFFNANTGRIVRKYDTEFRDFARNLNKNNASGLDGLVDQLHNSAITRGAMAVEVIVAEDLSDVEQVLLVDPKSISEFKWLPDKNRYAAYQANQYGKKQDLYDGNFFFVPHNARPGSPVGTLQFEPAIVTMTQFYQLIQDSMEVLNRIGYPRYKAEINQSALLASATPAQKSTPSAQAEYYQEAFSQVEGQLQRMGKDNDLITFDSVKVDVLGGGVNGAGIDVRAWFEVLEPLICNAFQLTPVLMGRLKSGSYSLGTAEYSIVVDTIDTMRRESKRILEDIANMWARVKGYNIRAEVKHNPIDWEKEKEKLETELLKVEKARRSEEYQWVSHDEAAQMGIGHDGASGKPQLDILEYLKHNKDSGSAYDYSRSSSSTSSGGNE